jgi:hypothetical protein
VWLMKINQFVQRTFLNVSIIKLIPICTTSIARICLVNKVKYNFQALLNYINCKYGNLLNCLFFYILRVMNFTIFSFGSILSSVHLPNATSHVPGTQTSNVTMLIILCSALVCVKQLFSKGS